MYKTYDPNYAQASWCEIDNEDCYTNIRGLIETTDMVNFVHLNPRSSEETDTTVEETICNIVKTLSTERAKTDKTICITPNYDDLNNLICYSCCRYVKCSDHTGVEFRTNGVTEYDAFKRNDVLMNSIITIACDLKEK